MPCSSLQAWGLCAALTMCLLCPPPITARPPARPQVWDPERVVIIPDHYIFTSDPRANRNVDILREVAQK